MPQSHPPQQAWESFAFTKCIHCAASPEASWCKANFLGDAQSQQGSIPASSKARTGSRKQRRVWISGAVHEVQEGHQVGVLDGRMLEPPSASSSALRLGYLEVAQPQVLLQQITWEHKEPSNPFKRFSRPGDSEEDNPQNSSEA